MRFGSKEIQEESDKFAEIRNCTSTFLIALKNTISQKLRLIDHTLLLTVKTEANSLVTNGGG